MTEAEFKKHLDAARRVEGDCGSRFRPVGQGSALQPSPEQWCVLEILATWRMWRSFTDTGCDNAGGYQAVIAPINQDAWAAI